MSTWLESSVWLEREALAGKEGDMVPTGIEAQTSDL